MTVQPVNVNIVNDDLLEIDEVFSASLTLVNPVIDARVQLLPNSAEVTILDEDGKCAIMIISSKTSHGISFLPCMELEVLDSL